MGRYIWIAVALFAVNSYGRAEMVGATSRKDLAKQYLRSLYGGDLSNVDHLIADDIIISYPVFETLFHQPLIRGRQAVRDFSEHFARKWVDGQLAIHEVIEEKDRVVIIWDFRARDAESDEPGQPSSTQEHRWGGITFIRFNKAGKIVAEIGEESDPGPIARIGGRLPMGDSTETVHEPNASGFFAPTGTPTQPPSRTNVGKNCMVELEQSYSVSGTLSGSFKIDYRILVDGPCGSPIGTFDEEWIAQGTFTGLVHGSSTAARFSYVASVKAGGDVDGRIVLGQGIEGELEVHGNFDEGKLAYTGWVQD